MNERENDEGFIFPFIILLAWVAFVVFCWVEF